MASEILTEGDMALDRAIRCCERVEKPPLEITRDQHGGDE
jgi:hypothetical protein